MFKKDILPGNQFANLVFVAQAYPKVLGRLAGTSRNVFDPKKNSSKQGVWNFQFSGISPQLFAALRGLHPHLCTPVLPRGQVWFPRVDIVENL